MTGFCELAQASTCRELVEALDAGGGSGNGGGALVTFESIVASLGSKGSAGSAAGTEETTMGDFFVIGISRLRCDRAVVTFAR